LVGAGALLAPVSYGSAIRISPDWVFTFTAVRNHGDPLPLDGRKEVTKKVANHAEK
jgi:hypothetical protein